MQNSTSNPIYDRLTRGSKWPSQRTATRIAAVVALGGVIVCIAYQLFMIYWSPYTPRPIVQIVTLAFCAGCVLQSVPLHYIAASITTTHYSISEVSPLLRLTSLTAEEIVTGYMQGITYRLNLPRAVADAHSWSSLDWLLARPGPVPGWSVHRTGVQESGRKIRARRHNPMY